jgi:signal transduction histidine kinase
MPPNKTALLQKPKSPVFTVDTHLFRELGNHLVGRDSTALIELVKNAYDADATEVTVIGSDLGDRTKASIVINDNGSGMNEREFRNGFLRIASRAKEQGDRRTPYFRRRFTGAKGIGRLAAHKLADLLLIHSISGLPGSGSRTGVDASIDWGLIEARDNLDEIASEVRVTALNLPRPQSPGTRIELLKLRKVWGEERAAFVHECTSLQAPDLLVSRLPESILEEPLLFVVPRQRLTSDVDKGFVLRLEGEFDTGESLWSHISGSAEWVVEIDAARPAKNKKAVVRYGVAPTRRRLERNKELRPEVYTSPHPSPGEGPFFQARILVQVKPTGSRLNRQEVRSESGIRVYVEGFRVLPYGDESNDWLTLNTDYVRRSRLEYASEVETIVASTQQNKKWFHYLLPNRSYFGAVFLTQEDAGDLTPLINREGFLPNPAYERLQRMVRIGIELFTRVRASTEYQERKSRKRIAPVRGSAVITAISEARRAARQARLAVSSTNPEDAETVIADLEAKLENLQENLGEFVAENDILRVTASVGTQMAEFVHEVQSLLGTAEAVNAALDRLRLSPNLSKDKRRELSAIHASMSDMRKQLERQASYLLDIATPDASRRRIRQRIAERFDAALKLVARTAEKRGITIRNEIPSDLKSPKMFPAELTTVFSNLLTNAVKNAGDDGHILANGREVQEGIEVTIRNTGNKVDLIHAERLFRPFVSTTTSVDATLGQGMGLGLTITRNTLEEYGGTIEFVRPGKRFASAVQIVFPA